MYTKRQEKKKEQIQNIKERDEIELKKKNENRYNKKAVKGQMKTG